MLLQMIILMTIASAVFEIQTVRSIPWLRRLYQRFSWLDKLASIGISYVLGTLFGAGGVVIAISAAASTLLTMWYWPVEEDIDRAWANVKALWDRRSELKEAYEQFIFAAKAVWSLILIPIKLIMAIIRGGMWLAEKYQTGHAKVMDFKSKFPGRGKETPLISETPEFKDSVAA